MKVIYILFSLSILLLQIACKDDNKIQNPTHTPQNNNSDIITMATPNGGKLKSAEEGPTRSALGVPNINLDSFQLTVGGLVNHSYSLTWEEIQQIKAVSTDTMLMYCVEGWEVIGNWKGILVKELLQKASVKNEGKHVLFYCVEGYTTSLPIAYIEKYNVMLSYEVNGKRLNAVNGFPLRLIAFGKFGYKWAKWVNELQVISESQNGYWEQYGYSDRADVQLERRKYYEGENAKSLDY